MSIVMRTAVVLLFWQNEGLNIHNDNHSNGGGASNGTSNVLRLLRFRYPSNVRQNPKPLPLNPKPQT